MNIRIIDIIAINFFVLVIGFTTIYTLLTMVGKFETQTQALSWITLIFTLSLAYIKIRIGQIIIRRKIK